MPDKKLSELLQQDVEQSKQSTKDLSIPLSEQLKEPTPGLSTPSGFFEGTQRDLTEEDYGLFSGMDQMRTRANRQGTGEQIAKTVANLPINIGAGILENAGYLGELANYGMKELTDQEYKADFSNALTKMAKSARDPFGEVYREDPNEVFDFDDPAWWLQNGGGLVESIGEFLATGVGVGKVIGSGANAMSKAVNNTMKASRASRGINKGLNAGAQGLTSATLGYVEGAISGSEVYKGAIDAGKSVEEASEAASTTVKWNTALIGALNATSVFPLFKSKNLMKRGEKFGLNRTANETTEEFAERMAKAQTNPSKATKSFYERFAIPLESTQEAIEEVTNLWAEVKGEQAIGMADTDKTGMELWGELLKSEEGILGAVLGALGGAGQTAGLRRIPFNKKAITTEDGEQELQWLSAKQLEDMQDEKVGISYAETLEKDTRSILFAQEDLKKAIEDKDDYGIRKAQHELFNISAKRSIPIDGGESVKASLREIAEMDNETDLGAEMQAEVLELEQQLNSMSDADPSQIAEIQERIDTLEQGASQLAGVSPAMQLGMTESMEDNEFKQTAREKLREVDEMREEYLNTIEEFNYGDEEAFNMGEYVFDIKQRRRQAKDHIEYLDDALINLESDLYTIQDEILPEDLQNEEGDYTTLVKLSSERTAVQENLKELQEEKSKISSEEATLKSKYKVQTKEQLKSVLDDSIKDAESKLDRLSSTIQEYAPELVQEAQANLGNTRALENVYKAKDSSERSLKTLNRRINYVSSAEGRKDFIKNAYNAHRSEVAKREELERRAKQKKAKEQEKQDIQNEREKKQAQEEQKKEEQKDKKEEVDTESSTKKSQEDKAPTLGEASTTGEETTPVDTQSDAVEATEETQEDTESSLVEEADIMGISVDQLKLFKKHENSDEDTLNALYEDPNIEDETIVKAYGLDLPFVKKKRKKHLDKIKNKSDTTEDTQAPNLGEGTAFETEVDEDTLDVAGEEDTGDTLDEGDTRNPTRTYSEMLKLVDAGLIDPRTLESGRKARPSHKIQYGPTTAWEEVTDANGVTRKVSSSNVKTAPNVDVLESKRKDVQDELKGKTLVISTDFEFTKESYDENDRVSDEPIDFDDIYNRPIKIEFEDGTLVGYVPTLNWITRQDKNGNYMNIVEEVPDGQGGFIDNAKIQIDVIKSIRKAIADQGDVESKIIGFSQGATIFNRTTDGKRKIDKASELLPDPNIKFSVVQGATIEIGNEVLEAEYEDGTVLAVDPVSGLQTPMWINSIDVATSRTIISAIEAVANNDEALIDEFAKVAGNVSGSFDFKAKDGLYNLASRSVFLKSFRLQDLSKYENPDRILFNIDDRSGYAYLARVGDNFVYTTNPKLIGQEGYEPMILNGSVVEDAINYIESLASNLNKDDLNSTQAYEEIVYDDKVDTKPYDNYNEYAKTKLSTYIDGRNTINHGTVENPDFEYLYFQNPVIAFDFSFITGDKKSTKQDKKLPDPNIEETQNTSSEEVKAPTGKTLFDLEEDNSEISNEIPPADDVDNEYGFAKGRLMSQEERSLVKKLSKGRISDFSNQQISEITDVIVFAVGNQIREDSTRSVQEIKDEVYDLFDNTQQQLLFNGDAERASRFNKILANWDSLYELAQNHLETVIGYERQQDDRLTGEESDFEKRKFDSKARWKENSKDTASSDLKMFLSSIPVQKWVRKEGKLTKVAERSEYLGLQKYVPLDEIYDKVTQLLVNKDPNIENFKELLKEQGTSYVPFSSVLHRLENLPPTSKVESEFVKVMAKQYIDLMVSLFEPAFDNETGDAIGFSFKPIHSDRNSAIDMIFGSWINAQKQSDLVKEVNGELVIDPEVSADIKEKYIEAVSGKKAMQVKGAIRELLESLGVKLDERTWDMALQLNAKAFSSKPANTNAEFGVKDGKPRSNTFLSFLFDELPDRGDEPTSFEVNNPLASGNMKSRFRRLAFFELNNTDKVYTDSFTDINGNTIYPYQMNSHYSTTLNKLKNDDKLVERIKDLSFSQFSEWLDNLDQVELEYVDGLRDQITKVGLSGENLGKMDTDILASVLYFGTVNQTQGKKGRYQTLTKSDKTTYPVIFAPRHDVGLNFKDNGEVKELLKDTRDRVKKIIKAEFSRVYNFRNKIQQDLESSDTEIQGYWYKNNEGEWEGGAQHFVLLPELNAEMAESYIGEAITQEEYNKVWDSGIAALRTSDGISESSLNIMYKIVEHRLLEESRELEQRWNNSNLITDSDLYIDTYYLRNQASKYSRDKAIKYALTDFTVNHFLSMSEEMMVLSGDPAQFWKQQSDLASSLKATHENMSKRLAKDIAPRSDGNYRTDEQTFVMSVMQDSVQNSRERKALGKAYSNMEIADAQEYTTTKEHLRVMRAEGNISPQKYTELIEVVNNPNENGYYEFTPEQMEQIFTPMKPVYTGNRVTPYDLNQVNYVKSSSFPLLPQMLQGFELDKIRMYMEEAGIDRAPFQTASKVGTVNPVKMFEGRNVVDTNPFTQANKMLLDRSGFGIQQEVPVKDKQEINVLSQANKLLFLGIRDVEGFEFDGSTFKGSELERVKEDIRIGLIKASEQELKDRLGISIGEDNNFQFDSFEKVKDILLEEAKERGWSINAIDSIELNEEGTGFEIPLALSPNSTSIESLILSLVSNITLGIKMDGYSYVQGSSAGLTTLEESNIDQSQIVRTKNFDPEYGLKFIEKKDGKTQPAQILLPWNYKDNEGNDLDINDFTDDNGVIIEEKLPAEARRMIGARIPTQGHNSMIPLEVVGFLPKAMGTLAIVPEEIVAQMGSDFDVDKLYTYQYNLEYNEETGALSKKEDNLSDYDPSSAEDVETTPVIPEGNPYANVPNEVLKQKYLEIFESVYSHESLFDKLKSPLDKPDLGRERDEIRAKLEEGLSITSPASYISQTDYRLNQRSGQQLVGIFALANTLNSLLEKVDQPIKLKEVITVEGEQKDIPLTFEVEVNGETITLDRISGTATTEYLNELRTKADNISLALSAAVDNANENVLGNINWNRTTAGVVSTLLMAQSSDGKAVNLAWVARFTSQPIIRDIVEKVEQLESTTSNVAPSMRMETAVKEVIATYRVSLNEEANPSSVESVSEDMLMSMIGNDLNSMTQSDVNRQLHLAEQFEQLYKVSEDIRDIQQILLSPATGGIDNTIIDAIESISDYKDLTDGFTYLENTQALVTREDGSINEQGVASESIYNTAESMINALLPEYKVYQKQLKNADDMNMNIHTTRNKKALWKGIKEYTMSKVLKDTDLDLKAERQRLIFDDDIGKRILDAQDTWGKNNYFLKRLQVELSENPGVEPSRIQFSADKAIRLDDLKNSMAIRDMLISDIKKQRDLARDLVLYDLITGGVQGARNFSKYIPPAYLSFLGLNNTSLEQDSSDMIVQILKNNPKLAPIFEATSQGVSVSGNEVHIVYDVLPDIMEQSEDQNFDYISMWLSDEKDWGLFEYSGESKTGQIFTKIPTMGWKDLSEYYPSTNFQEFKENGTSIFDSRATKDAQIDSKPAAPIKQQEGKTKAHNDVDSRGRELLDPFLTEDIKSSGIGLLSDVLSKDMGEEYNTIAKFLRNELGEDVKFNITRKIDNFVATYRESDNSVNIDLGKLANKVDKEGVSIQEVILHEAVHAATVQAIKRKELPQVDQLEALRKKVQRELSEELTPDYKVDTLEEFVAFAMTNREFQNRLNGIKFNNQTGFQRFLDLIKSLVESIAQSMGVTVKKDSALEASISNIVELIKDDTGGVTNLGEASPFEFGMPSFYNKGIDPTIEKVANVLKTRITTVKKNITKSDKDSNKYRQLVNTLNRLQEDLQTLEQGNSANAIKRVAEAQAKWAKTMLQDDTISDSLFFTVKNVIESWDYEGVTKDFLRHQLQSRENPLRTALKEASELMVDQKDIMDAKLISRVKDYINKDLPQDAQVTTKDLKFMEDIGFSEEWLMDLSTVDNQLAQYIFDMLSTASRSATDELLTYDTKLTEVKKGIDDFNVFRQKDEEGNFTGNFIDEYSEKYQIRKQGIVSEFYKTMRSADNKKEPLKGKIISKAIKDYHKAINEIEEVVDTRILTIDNFASPIWDSREEYISYLKEEYGEDKAQSMIDQAKSQYAEYEQQKRHYENSLEVEYETADTDLSFDLWKKEQMKEWESKHDPMRALNEKFGVIGESITTYKAQQANDFLTSVPRKTIKGETTGFYDQNFQNLTEQEKEFYNFYINSIQQFMNYLPNYKVRGLSRNFLPKISMDFVEVMNKEGVKGALRYMNTRMKDSISTGVSPELVQTELSSYQEIDPSTGLPKKELMSDFADQMLSKDRLEADEISFNIPVILRQFAGMAINFKYKSAVEDRANLAMHVMRQAKSVQRKGGKTIRDKVGNLVAAKEGVVGLTNSTQYFIDAMLYGEKRDQYNESSITIFDSWNPFENTQKRDRMKQIENLRDQLEEELQSKLVSQEEYDDRMEKLKEEYKELGGKNLVWGKIGDRFLEYTQMKGMGWNITAGIANVGFGFLSNLTWAASNQDFTTKQIAKAMGIIMKSLVPGTKNYKLANLIKKFDVLFEVTETEYGTEADKRTKTSSKSYNFIANTLHPFEIQRRTEYGVQGMSLLAQMFNTDVEVTVKATGEKKTINLYEAFNDNAEWKSEYEPIEEWTSPSEGFTKNKFSNFRNKVIQLNKYLHGNYDPNSPVLAKKYVIGRMLFQFRSWMPMGFAQRFKGEYYDRQLGRTFKGRYRTFGDLGIVDSLRGLMGVAINSESMMSSKKGAGDPFSDTDIANLRMNLRELQVLIGFIALGVALRASLDDDDEDSWGSFTGHILMNQLYRVEQDIYFYLSPGTFEEILKNPMPVMKTYKDFESAVFSSMDYITDSEYEGSRLGKKWARALPLANQFTKMDFIGSRDLRDM